MLNRHQYDHDVAAREYTDDAQQKQRCADHQVVQRRDVEHGVHQLRAASFEL